MDIKNQFLKEIDRCIKIIEEEINFHESDIKAWNKVRNHEWEKECFKTNISNLYDYKTFCLFCTKQKEAYIAIESLNFSITILNQIKKNCK